MGLFDFLGNKKTNLAKNETTQKPRSNSFIQDLVDKSISQTRQDIKNWTDAQNRIALRENGFDHQARSNRKY